MTGSHSSHVLLRAYQSGDLQGISALIVQIQREEFDIPITMEDQPDLADIDGFYNHGAGGFWVAVDGEKIVGTIALLDISNNQVALRKMFVDQNYRGAVAGVAQKLLNHAIDASKQSGVMEIFLGTTADFLAAHRFYEKHGFKQFSKTDLPPRFPIMAVDSRFYRLAL